MGHFSMRGKPVKGNTNKSEDYFMIFLGSNEKICLADIHYSGLRYSSQTEAVLSLGIPEYFRNHFDRNL